MKNLILCLICLMLIICGTGCGTFITGRPGQLFGKERPVDDSSLPAVYPATCMDAVGITGWCTPGGRFLKFNPLFAGIALIDLPVSITSDTLFLPFDLVYLHKKNEHEKEKEKWLGKKPED